MKFFQILFLIPGHKILVITPEPRDISPKFDEIHHLSAVPTVSVYSHLRTPRNAVIRRPVQLRGRHSCYQLQYIPHRVAYCLPGIVQALLNLD